MSATRQATATRLDRAHQFDMSALAEAAASARVIDYTQIPVLPPSGAVGRDGRGPFTYAIQTVIANVRANGQDIPVFLDHEPGKAYGWLQHKEDPVQMADGSWEWPLYYTDEGMAALDSRAYRYNSPTWLFIQDPAINDRQAGEIVGILEVSLTNLPNQYLRSLNSAEQGATYTVNIPLTDAEMNAEQLAALGLAEDAAPGAVIAAINSLKAAAARADAIVAEAGAAADADAPAVVEAAANSRVAAGALVTKQAFDEAIAAKQTAETALATAEQARTTAEQALATFKSEQQAAAVNSAVDTAIAEGKFTPAMRESLHSLASKDLTAFTALATATSKHAALKPLATPDTSDETFGLDAQELAICKTHGIKPEIFAANKRKNA